MRYFDDVKIGDKVWSFEFGWGEVKDIIINNEFNILVQFKLYGDTYSLDGIRAIGLTQQTLFYDEVKFEVPKRPLPKLEVDTKVLVWNHVLNKKKRYFSHFNRDGKIACFNDGTTSFSKTSITTWENWELYEDEE